MNSIKPCELHCLKPSIFFWELCKKKHNKIIGGGGGGGSNSNYEFFARHVTDSADCKIILSTLCLKSVRVNGEEVHIHDYNPATIGVMRVHIIQSGNCNCIIMCVLQYGWMSSLCIVYPYLCQNSKLASGRLCQKLNLESKEQGVWEHLWEKVWNSLK